MSDINTNEEEGKKNLNFIEAAVEKDLAEGKNGGRVQLSLIHISEPTRH